MRKFLMAAILILISGCGRIEYDYRVDRPRPIFTNEDIQKHPTIGIATFGSTLPGIRWFIAKSVRDFAGVKIAHHDVSQDIVFDESQDTVNHEDLQAQYPGMRYVIVVSESNAKTKRHHQRHQESKECNGEEKMLDVDVYETVFSADIEVALFDLSDGVLLARAHDTLRSKAAYTETEHCPSNKLIVHIFEAIDLITSIGSSDEDKYPPVNYIEGRKVGGYAYRFLQYINAEHDKHTYWYSLDNPEFYFTPLWQTDIP